MAQDRPEAVCHFHSIAMRPKVQDHPHKDRCYKDGSTCFGKVVLYLFPYIDCHSSGAGGLIFRQLNQQIIFRFSPVNQMDDRRYQDSDHQADQVHGIGHEHGAFLKEHLGKQDVDWQTGAATHKGRNQHDLKTVTPVFQRP